MNSQDTRHHTITLSLVLAVMTLVVWWPVGGNGFINFDDPDYVLQNPVVLQGLTLSGIGTVFTQAMAANWHPLTWMSHMLDVNLFGIEPAGHHLMSLFFHAANVVLLFTLLRRLTGSLWRAALVAALFSLHPLRVESVAWISERKDVLSTLFWLLTLHAYASYARQQDRRRYLLVAGCFALGLMAKPMVVTLPCVLLLVDFWPLRRAALTEANGVVTWPSLKRALGPLIREKIPLFALAAVASVVTVLAQRSGGAVSTLEAIPLPLRLANAVASVLKYLGKTFWPTDLAIFYPYPDLIPWPSVLGGLAVLGVVSWTGARQWGRMPWLAWGWLWFLGTLVPVIGIVQVGSQAMADRYTYVPLIGIFVALVWTAAEFSARWPGRVVIQATLAAAALVACLWATRIQIGYWKNSETVFARALPVTTRNVVAHINLGNAYFEQGKMDAAIAEFAKALKVRPNYGQAHFNWGNVLTAQEKWDEAIAHYQEALRMNASLLGVRINLGNALFSAGKHDEALAQLREVIKERPDDFRAHNNLGNSLAMLGRWNEAVPAFEQALKLNPASSEPLDNWAAALADQGKVNEAEKLYNDALKRNPADARAHNELGRLLAERNQLNEAAGHYTEALRLNPNFAEAHLNFGMAYVLINKPDEALQHFLEALRLQPNSAQAHNNLGFVFGAQGKFAEAAKHYAAAIQLKPTLAPALNSLARIRATQKDAQLRNGAEAVKLAEEAVKLTQRQQPLFLDTLAAAHAEAGDFSKAVVIAREAMQVARQQNQPGLVAQVQTRLSAYEVRQAWRE